MRVLIAARLSVLHDGETGLDSQEREVIAWAERKGYEVVAVVPDHKTGKSDLAERPNLRPWVTEPSKLAQYDAIVALKVDRLTRADDEGVDRLKAWARQHHKSLLISSADVQFPSEGMEGVRWDMYVRMAHQEWLDIRERYARMVRNRHEVNSFVGKPPWGYEIVRLGDGLKTLEPTPEGRKWVPSIFAWVVEEKPLRDICRRLYDEGATEGMWHESRLIKLVKCATYHGARSRQGRAPLQVEGLVSKALQEKARGVIASRARTGRTAREKVLLASLKCGHPDCAGAGEWPMYRGSNGSYMRCSGKGPGRKGCGAPMVALSVIDPLVMGFAEYWDDRPYVDYVYVEGNAQGERLEALRDEMGNALAQTPASEIAAVAADYAARIAALEEEGSLVPHWEEVETDKTEGQYLRSLDLEGRRAYLAKKDIRAWRDSEGRTCVTIDGALARTGGRTVVAEMNVDPVTLQT